MKVSPPLYCAHRPHSLIVSLRLTRAAHQMFRSAVKPNVKRVGVSFPSTPPAAAVRRNFFVAAPRVYQMDSLVAPKRKTITIFRRRSTVQLRCKSGTRRQIERKRPRDVIVVVAFVHWHTIHRHNATARRRTVVKLCW